MSYNHIYYIPTIWNINLNVYECLLIYAYPRGRIRVLITLCLICLGKMMLLVFHFSSGICNCEERCLSILFDLNHDFLTPSNPLHMIPLNASLHSEVWTVEKKIFYHLDQAHQSIYQHSVAVLQSIYPIQTSHSVFEALK